jgi:hypothetical protein
MMMENKATKSLRTFMTGIVDYAGLYPPASLPLEEAIRNFVRYQDDPEAWMLARFVVPAKRLPELSQLAATVFSSEHRLSFSALGRSGENIDEFLDHLELDLRDINDFRNEHVSQVLVNMFEVTIPESVLANQASCDDLIISVSDVLLVDDLTPFFEAPFGEDWESRAKTLIKSVQKLEDVGFKLRTGGVEAHMFPSPEQVAWAIIATRDAGVPMKATAGLHHPIRHFNESVQTKMHGFLNVFCAGILAHVKRLSQKDIQIIIEDEDPASFQFDETGLAWRHLSATNQQIEAVRQNGFVSFGSCSFDEPREDLQALGLLRS